MQHCGYEQNYRVPCRNRLRDKVEIRVLGSNGPLFGPGGQGVMSDLPDSIVLCDHYAKPDINLGDGNYHLDGNTIR